MYRTKRKSSNIQSDKKRIDEIQQLRINNTITTFLTRDVMEMVLTPAHLKDLMLTILNQHQTWSCLNSDVQYWSKQAVIWSNVGIYTSQPLDQYQNQLISGIQTVTSTPKTFVLNQLLSDNPLLFTAKWREWINASCEWEIINKCYLREKWCMTDEMAHQNWLW